MSDRSDDETLRSGAGRGLVLGATGFLGQRVASVLATRGVDATLAGRAVVDLTQPGAATAAIGARRPAWVLNLAAVNPGQDSDTAMAAVNGAGAAEVAEACAAGAIRLVHVSSDLVHDGSAAPYTDDAEPDPLPGGYASSKAEGDRAVRASHPGALVVRTSLLFDLDAPDRATVDFARRLTAGEPIGLFADVVRQPAYVPDLATALVALALDHPDEAGSMNLVGDEVTTRAAYTRALLEWFDVPHRHETTDIDGPAGVPRDLRLRLDRAAALGLSVRGVRQAIADAAISRA